MEALLVISMATVMAIFGVLGYLRGSRAGLVTLAITSLGMLILSSQSSRVVTLINGIGVGVRFVLAGGLSALGGSGNDGDTFAQIVAQARQAPPLIPRDRPEAAVLAVLAILVLVALLLGLLKWIRRPASLGGLILGLLNGYLLSAYVLASLAPELALLPSPFLPRSAAQAAATRAAASGGPGLSQIMPWLQALAKTNTPAIALAVGIALLALVATRFSGDGKKR